MPSVPEATVAFQIYEKNINSFKNGTILAMQENSLYKIVICLFLLQKWLLLHYKYLKRNDKRHLPLFLQKIPLGHVVFW
jgi:hypothetical protein